MTSGVRVCCTLSAENCFLDDNKKGEAVADDKDIVAPKLSAIVRHMHGDTGVVPNGTSVPSCSAYKKLLQRPSQPPPPPPPCPYGDSAEDENTIIAAGERHFMMPSPALMTGLQLQQQQQQQQPRYRYRPGQRSPLRQTSKTLQSKDKDEKHEDENATAAGGGRTAVSSSEAPIDAVLPDAVDDLDRTAAADGGPQKLLRLTEDAADREMDDVAAAAALDLAAAAVDSSSEHVDDGTHSSAIQTSELVVGLIPVTTSNDDVDRCSSGGGPQWIKRRPCAVIVEEASLDELLEKTEKLEQELRKQLDIKKQKTLDIARQEERIRVLERLNSELKMELTAKESELTKKDIKMAVIEEKNENLAKRLKSTQDVLAKLENDYERVVEDKLEFKSLYIDGRLRASEAIGDLTEEINRQIEAKRSFIRLAQQNITTRSANGLKKALATTSDYLHLKCERNRLLDKVQYLKTRLEAQDLYIEDLSSAVRELSRIIQYYNVPLPCMEERAEIEQWEHRKPDDEDHSSMGRCATMSDYSSGEESATFESTTRRPEEEAEEIEYQPNEEDDLEKELEDICGQTSDSDGRTETTEESIVLEFRTPLSSPSPTIKSQTLRETTADEDDTEDYDDGEE